MTVRELFPDTERNPIFRGIPEEILNSYLNDKSMRIKHYASDEVVHSSQSGEIRIGLILGGSARVYTANTDKTLLRTMGRGAMFGIANLYAEEEPFPSTIVAAEPCQILFIDSATFRRLIEENATALRNYLFFQSKKIVYLNRKIMTFTAGSAEKKLAIFLLENEVDGTVAFPCSMSRLADMLSMGRASLYRALDHLGELGLIEKHEKTIIILNLPALSKFS